MMRSLFAGVSGLRNNQVRMDVIGNNVANANTLGFKAGRVTFQEGYAQLLRGGSRPQNGLGGINPQQVGTGMRVGSVDTLFSQGSFETTGIQTDLAIQGGAFFAVSDGQQTFYTRAGNFQLDSEGRMVTPGNGMVLQGRMATDGILGGPITEMKLPLEQKAPARATTETAFNGNLDASAPIWTPTNPGDTPLNAPAADRDLPANRGAWAESSITAYDTLGTKHELKIVMWKTDADSWDWAIDPSALSGTALGVPAPAGGGTLDFGPDGLLVGPSSAAVTWSPSTSADPVSITIDPGAGIKGLTHFAGKTTAALRDQDGYPMGNLADFGIDQSGTITGSFDNGTSLVLGQVALAEFSNEGGLMKSGSNLYATSPSSGEPVMGFSGEGSTSSMASGSLEMSNVDLAAEFTQMIIAQRAFAAAGRTITTSDEMLQEVVNLKR